MQKLFTLDEANALLPLISALFYQVHELRREHQAAQAELNQVEIKARSNGRSYADEIAALREKVERLAADLLAKLEEILATGCEIKDVDTGLIDFQSERDGRVVYLCWKMGEDQIRFWHELDTGYNGRRPL